MVDFALGSRRLARGLAALSFLVAVSPATAQPFSTEERLGEPAESEAILWQNYPQVVFDGQSYVVIWETARSTSSGMLFLARVNEDGKLLDEHGVLVTRHSLSSLLTISAAPWGSLVVFPFAGDIVGVRLGRGGELFDPTQRVLATGGVGFPSPSVACLDTGCLLLFNSRESANPKTLGVALDGCGEPIPGTELELPEGQWKVRAAVDGYVAFGRTPPSGAPYEYELVAVGMTADGQRRFGPVKLASTRDTTFAFGAGPSGSLALWKDPEGSEVRAVCLDSEGKLAGEHVVLSSDETISLGGMSTEGNQYRVGILIGGSAGFLTLDRCGQLLEAPVTVSSIDIGCRLMPPGVASGARSAFLTWEVSSFAEECEKPPRAAAIVPAGLGRAATPVAVEGAAARMGPPALGSDGTSYLAAWHEDRDDASGLYTQTLDAAGIPLERAVLTIPAEAHPAPPRTASVAFVGGRYVVELHASQDRYERWSEPNVAAEVDPRALTRGARRIQEKLGTPGANTFLDVQTVVHRQGEDIMTLDHLTVRATDASSAPLSAEWVHEYSQDLWDREPRVAFDGTSFAVVWLHGEDIGSGSVPDEQLFMRFDETGQPLLSAPVVVPGLGEYTPSSLTFGAGAYLLTLQTFDGSQSLVRLSTEGELLDTEPRVLFAASENPVQREFLGSTFDGEAFVLAWSERALSGINEPAVGPTDVDVRVVRVAADGTPLSDGRVTSSREDEIASAGLASVGDGRSLLGYHRFDDDPAYYALRGVFRILGTGDCSTELACSDDACDEGCCVRGCTKSAPAVSCELADCASECEAGTHCVPGLGCVTDATRPPARVIRTEGCGCGIPERGRGSLGPILALLAAALAAWRRSGRERNVRFLFAYLPAQSGKQRRAGSDGPRRSDLRGIAVVEQVVVRANE